MHTLSQLQAGVPCSRRRLAVACVPKPTGPSHCAHLQKIVQGQRGSGGPLQAGSGRRTRERRANAEINRDAKGGIREVGKFANSLDAHFARERLRKETDFCTGAAVQVLCSGRCTYLFTRRSKEMDKETAKVIMEGAAERAASAKCLSPLQMPFTRASYKRRTLVTFSFIDGFVACSTSAASIGWCG
eukprot:scaffold26816_cov29-Tisochrysis_lutea.AAC.2